MANRLLDRQISLLEHLTSGNAIFGDNGDTLLDRSLRGMDPAMLRLEARFSYRKRMEKILAVFPKTFELLGSNQDPIVREFVETCPPNDISRLVNGRQFHGLLSAHWRRERPDPPYLPDVAACELACAEVRVDVEERKPAAASKSSAGRRRIRRCSGVALLRCSYDVRSIFEEGTEECPAERDTPIVIAMPPGAKQPQVSELLPVIFDLLAALDDWTDPADFGDTRELKQIIHELAEHGLLEVGR